MVFANIYPYLLPIDPCLFVSIAFKRCLKKKKTKISRGYFPDKRQITGIVRGFGVIKYRRKIRITITIR